MLPELNTDVGPLLMVTHFAADPDATRHFYGDLMGMDELAPFNQPDPQAELHARLWGLDDSSPMTVQHYARGRQPEVPRVRVVAVGDGQPLVRPDMEVRLDGGLSVGFAVRNHDEMEALVARAAERGVDTTAGITSIELNRPDGTPYEALETHFKAPDCVYGLAVGRPEDLPPVGPIEAGRVVGGPAYSAQVVNGADPDLDFYRDAFGFEVRRDLWLTSSGPAGGLGLAPDTRMRFIQIYAPGTETAYLVMLDFGDIGLENPTPVRPPSRGVGVWTFSTRAMDTVLERAAECGAAVVGPPVAVRDPLWGDCRMASLMTPRGFLLELVEAAH